MAVAAVALLYINICILYTVQFEMEKSKERKTKWDTKKNKREPSLSATIIQASAVIVKLTAVAAVLNGISSSSSSSPPLV